MKRLWLFTALLLVVATVACQQVNIDTNSNPNGGGGANLQVYAPIGQSFTAVAPHVEWIGMSINDSGCPAIDFQLTLVEGSGTSGTVVATQTATQPSGFDGFLYFNFSKTPLVVGNQYTAVLSQSGGGEICGDFVSVTNTGELPATFYSGGAAFSQGEALNGVWYFLRVLTAMFAAQVQPPLNPDGSSTFTAGTVIPVSFTLTADGTATCTLPPAALSLFTAEKRLSVMAPVPFNVGSCKYTYNLPTGSLSPGTYELDIALTNSTPTPLEVGSVLFTLD